MSWLRKPVCIGMGLFLGCSMDSRAQDTGRITEEWTRAGGSLRERALPRSVASDPGVRGGMIDAGSPLPTLTAPELAAFNEGLGRFTKVDSVTGTLPGEPGDGLGPTFNTNSCMSCHSQPATGGTSPSLAAFPFVGPNPEVGVATLDGATNQVPFFVTADGPVREARFKFFVSNGQLTNVPDGSVHELYTIRGRVDATNTIGISGAPQTCALEQPDFALNQQLGNITFRIPTPLFGDGLIENIPEATILANMDANAAQKAAFGVSGQPNRSGNDGTITRFGWKAQNKSLPIFDGEAYNVEQGVTNELFQNERPIVGNALPESCLFNGTPEDRTDFAAPSLQLLSDVEGFSTFLRFLDQPHPSTTMPGGAQSIAQGRQVFENTAKCALCHTPTLRTGGSSFTAALQFANANLYSDLLVHHMGTGLADGITQGQAGPDQFRTAPLWGLGQRIFFLHDGRTSDLVEAIEQHASPGSEANQVIDKFNHLSDGNRQDLVNFLRSL